MSGWMGMDYGPDWPPAPQPPKPERLAPARGRRALRRCVVAIVAYTLIAVGGLLLLHMRQQHVPPFDPYKPSAAASSTAR